MSIYDEVKKGNKARTQGSTLHTEVPIGLSPEDYVADIESNQKVGSYGEGMIARTKQVMDALKNAVKQGKMTVAEYSLVADPILSRFDSIAQAIGGSGSAAANAASASGMYDIYNRYMRKDVDQGKQVMRLPFSKTEYAQLPDSVLPTKEDANKSLFDSTLAPMQRFRPAQVPSTPSQPSSNPLDRVPTDLLPPEMQNSKMSVPSAPETVESPRGGIEITPTDAGQDQAKLLAEAELQKKLTEETTLKQSELRRQRLNDYSALLAKQQERLMSESQPGIYEDLNRRGLLQSSALGQAFADKSKELTSATNELLAKQALEDRDVDTSTMGNTLKDYLANRQSTIQRGFSLEDFQREANTAKELNATLAPSIRPSSGGAGKGALEGAASGAAAGSAGGPWGSAIGGTLGAAGGAIAGKNK